MVDYLIVGGGSAGCVLAGCLSEAGAEVALLEAGRDVPPTAVPADIADLYPRASFNSQYFWDALVVETGFGRSPFLAPKLLGGGSSVNGMFHGRGMPEDYDAWAAEGSVGWSWSDVRPSFERVESELSHVRHEPGDWSPYATAVGTAAARRGWPVLTDMNTDFADGYGPVALAATSVARSSAATSYLGAAVRTRPNLRVECGVEVERLEFERDRCVGVTALCRGERQQYDARHVILAAGGIYSPTLLLRSGIGDPKHLESLGLGVVAPLTGVGQGLQNHPIAFLATLLKREARQDPSRRSALSTALRFSSEPGNPDCRGDMTLIVTGRSSWFGVGAATAALAVILYAPDSRGSIRLASADPRTMPAVDFAMLSEASDRRRMADGFALAVELMQDDAVKALRYELFVGGHSSIVRRLNRPGIMNSLLSKTIRVALDGPPSVRSTLIRHGIAGDVSEEQMGERTWIEHVVETRTSASFHPAGTCRMGPDTDPEAVVAPDCRVHGVEGLSVADASIMPRIVRANTNLPTMMIAEHAARLLVKRG